MKFLLLGGTGAMGIHLTEILVREKNEVYVTTRKRRKDCGKIKYIVGNAHDDSFLTSVLKQNFDCIVDFMVYTGGEFKLRAEKLLASTKQYVFISSSRVYADANVQITETSPRLLDVVKDEDYLNTDEYALAKARQENLLFENSHKNWTIIRPYITYSENRLQLGVFEKEEWLFLALYGNAMVFSKDISSHTTTLTYGYDVARGIAAVMGRESALGEVFHITGNGCSIRWDRVLAIYRKILSENGFDVKVYEPDICYRIDNNKTKYQVVYDRYFDRIFDNSKIAKFIDTASFMKPQEGLEKCLNEFLQKKDFLSKGISEGIINAVRNYDVQLPIAEVGGAKQQLKYILARLGFLK